MLYFKKLLQHFNQDPNELFIWYELRKIYLFYDAVHLVRNIRSNLLNYKRFIFPSFKFDGFKDPINVPDGEIKWKVFHDVHEKDDLLEANLRKAPKLTTKVLDPGNPNKTFRQHLQYSMKQLLLLFNLIFQIQVALLSS